MKTTIEKIRKAIDRFANANREAEIDPEKSANKSLDFP